MAATKPLSKADREKCWAARDEYFKCLDKHGLWLDGFKPTNHEEIMALEPVRFQAKSINDRSLTKEERETLFQCKQFSDLFKKECLASWVTHFGISRVKDLQMDYLRRTTAEREQHIRQGSSAFWDKVSAK